nr:DUF427 domain-containing protein [Fluviibacterium aquatile]
MRVVYKGVTVADTIEGWLVCEKECAPTYYIPIADWLPGTLVPAKTGNMTSQWMGRARYYHVVVGHAHAARAAWAFPEADGEFAPIRNAVSVYANLMEACFVGREKVLRQSNGYDAGWITPNLTGITQTPAMTESG